MALREGLSRIARGNGWGGVERGPAAGARLRAKAKARPGAAGARPNRRLLPGAVGRQVDEALEGQEDRGSEESGGARPEGVPRKDAQQRAAQRREHREEQARGQDRVDADEAAEPHGESRDRIRERTDGVEVADVRRGAVGDQHPAVGEHPEVAVEHPVVPVEAVDDQRDEPDEHRVPGTQGAHTRRPACLLRDSRGRQGRHPASVRRGPVVESGAHDPRIPRLAEVCVRNV